MTRFSATVSSTGAVPASRAAVWSVLVDPEMIVAMTPLLTRIEATGDTWRWHMQRVGALGLQLAPTFTERMSFTELTRIDFSPQPPAGSHEWAAVEGCYRLADDGDRTQLSISVTVTIEAPLPRAARPTVTRAMKATMHSMGDRFAANLERQVRR